MKTKAPALSARGVNLGRVRAAANSLTYAAMSVLGAVPADTKACAQADVRWKPVRRGPIYCSPACGGGCTYAAFVAATKHANSLCWQLDTTTNLIGWRTHVWENLGWHHSAISPCGRIKVHAHNLNKGWSYTAFLGAPGDDGGRWSEPGKTPAAAVKKVVAVAKAELTAIGAVLTGL